MYDELIKRLRNRRICIQQLGTLNDYPLLGEAADAIETMSEAYDKLSRHMDDLAALMPRWIPVAERLPEDGQWVLVWGHGQKIPIMMFHESGAWIDDQFEFHTTITHWMPLPAHPKEK